MRFANVYIIMISSILVSLGIGLGITLLLFASILFYKVFFQETNSEKPLVIMVASFIGITIGISLLSMSILSLIWIGWECNISLNS